MKLSRKIKQQSNLTVTVIIVLAILVVVNILGGMVFHRFDLTENKTYSLSKTTKQSLKSLDDLVTIKVYLSKELPNRLLVLRQEVVDFLSEYENVSGGKIKVQFTDPQGDSQAEQEAMMYGIPPLQFSVQEEDKFQVSSGYIGLAVVYSDKSESIPVISSLENLEYDLTTAIYKVSQTQIPTIGFLTGHGEISLMEEAEVVQKELEKLYQVMEVDITDGSFIDQSVQTLVIAGPKEELSERELFIIDQFLMSGHSVLFLVDQVDIGDNLMASVNQTGLEKLLEHYGVRVNNDLVMDSSNEIASFRTTQGGFYVNYPFWIKARRDFFDLENPVVNKLEAISLPWTSSVELILEKTGENKISELIKSTPKSMLQSDPFNLDPQQPFEVVPEELTQSTLAIAVSGKFNSYFNDKEPPMVEEEGVSVSENVISQTDNGRIIVLGNARFMNNQFIQQFPYNLVFLQNAIDSLTLDESLISIRSKQPTNRPLEEVSKEKKMALRYVNVFGVTVLVVLLGLIRFVIRKRKTF